MKGRIFVKIKIHDRRKKSVFKHEINHSIMLLCVQGVSVGRIQNYYLAGFIFCAALLNMFLENETVGIKALCLVLLLGNFAFASLFHSLKSRVSDKKK
jgi:hypothetical protein